MTISGTSTRGHSTLLAVIFIIHQKSADKTIQLSDRNRIVCEKSEFNFDLVSRIFFVFCVDVAVNQKWRQEQRLFQFSKYLGCDVNLILRLIGANTSQVVSCELVSVLYHQFFSPPNSPELGGGKRNRKGGQHDKEGGDDDSVSGLMIDMEENHY